MTSPGERPSSCTNGMLLRASREYRRDLARAVIVGGTEDDIGGGADDRSPVRGAVAVEKSLRGG
jgi:hypothetical protein